MGIVDRIQKLCKNADTTLTSLERELGLGQSTIRKWDNNLPSVDKVRKVAEYFGVSIDYLLGTSPTDDETEELLSQLRSRPELKMLFSVSQNATKEQIEAVAEMINKWNK